MISVRAPEKGLLDSLKVCAVEKRMVGMSLGVIMRVKHTLIELIYVPR